MSHAIKLAADYLETLFDQHEELFPDDATLRKSATEKEWREVFKRLVVIRDSETPEQRLGYFRQMMTNVEPSCMAETIIRQVKKLYLEALAERELLDGL